MLLIKDKTTGKAFSKKKPNGMAQDKKKSTVMALIKERISAMSLSKKKSNRMAPNKGENPGKEPNELRPVIMYTSQDLKRFTYDFSDDNFIGNTMFGKVYHGKIVKDEKVIYVTVKIWVDREIYEVQPDDKVSRLKDELTLLEHNELNTHPNLVKLLGFCFDAEVVGVVYELKALGTIYSLFVKETFSSFNWLQRIKAAVGLARALEFFHNSNHGDVGYLVRNIGPQHIMLDENYCPRIFDFGMLCGGFLSNKSYSTTGSLQGCYGYFDPIWTIEGRGKWGEYCDVYSFGGVLIGLLTNKLYEEEGMSSDDYPFQDLFDWAEDALTANRMTNVFRRIKCCLVHESLKEDKNFHRSDGYQITELMMRCIHTCKLLRPTTTEVVQCLLKLRVVKEHAGFIGVKDLLRSYKLLDELKNYRKGSNYFNDLYMRNFETNLAKYGIGV